MTTVVQQPKAMTVARDPSRCTNSPTQAHHWFIERCRGEDYSAGVCGYCGKAGKFPNYMPESFVRWELE